MRSTFWAYSPLVGRNWETAMRSMGERYLDRGGRGRTETDRGGRRRTHARVGQPRGHAPGPPAQWFSGCLVADHHEVRRCARVTHPQREHAGPALRPGDRAVPGVTVVAGGELGTVVEVAIEVGRVVAGGHRDAVGGVAPFEVDVVLDDVAQTEHAVGPDGPTDGAPRSRADAGSLRLELGGEGGIAQARDRIARQLGGGVRGGRIVLLDGDVRP